MLHYDQLTGHISSQSWWNVVRLYRYSCNLLKNIANCVALISESIVPKLITHTWRDDSLMETNEIDLLT